MKPYKVGLLLEAAVAKENAKKAKKKARKLAKKAKREMKRVEQIITNKSPAP